jgi:hypothetical protein
VSTASCPRCGGQVQAPGLWSDSWSCPRHGDIAPLRAAALPTPELLRQYAQRSGVPLWLPWPLPPGWLVTGLRTAGSDRTGPVATVLACSGPHPLPDGRTPRSADLLLIAEQPGTGLGEFLAGLSDIDPGSAAAVGAPNLRVAADGHETPLWAVESSTAAAYVGEASGVWLWVVVRPHEASAVLLEQFELLDARQGLPGELLPTGALCPLLK